MALSFSERKSGCRKLWWHGKKMPWPCPWGSGIDHWDAAPLRVVVSGSAYVHLWTMPYYHAIALNSLQYTGLSQPQHVYSLPIAQGTKAGFSQARALLQARPRGNLSMFFLPPESGSYA